MSILIDFIGNGIGIVFALLLVLMFFDLIVVALQLLLGTLLYILTFPFNLVRYIKSKN